MLLLLQVAIIKMPQWRYDTPMSGLYALACQSFTCPTEARVDVSKIDTKSLLVHEHPSRPGAFAVDAVIVNKAPFVQPFPRLILSFRNLQNQLIYERIFLPAEYLGGELSGEKTCRLNRKFALALRFSTQAATQSAITSSPINYVAKPITAFATYSAIWNAKIRSNVYPQTVNPFKILPQRIFSYF